ncbi:cyclin-dependent kinase 11A-like [Spodoptera frugiperda]|uniref:Cyclin-dependent kinase 11A-like n=1 Tax=Spodoptera frugiperda TaxID=7108 RepID=A0A9R0DS57_SPOFR|nr:cyclin-dependent kinase 11A-like [Spodoptera frugiperda]
MPNEATVRKSQQLLKAVQHLHDHHVMHCNLKTSNIWLSNKGVMKVEDFRMAREHEFPRQQYTPGMSCRSVDEFQYLYKINVGSFRVVHGAKDKRTGELVALKQLKKINEREGYSIAARRDLEILLKMQHPNIVASRGLASSSRNDRVYIVMELVDYDLKTFMQTMHSDKQLFSVEHVKCLMKELLKAVQHLHDHHVIHSDLKISNILLSNEGVLKVADSGMARDYEFPL